MNLSEVVRHNFLILVVAGAGVILLIFGALQISSSSKPSADVTFVSASPAPKVQAAKITVDVEGAVIKPGVYKLDSSARIVDSLAAAGGMSEEADRDYVQKNINLAKKVADGDKIYIPRVGEDILSSDSGVSSSGNSVGESSTININTATETDLDSLPGVGPVTAGKIISGRPYSSIQDLLNKKVVGQAEFDKIKDQISAN